MSILFNMRYTPQYMGGGYTLQTPVDNVLYSNKTTISTGANANAEALIFPNLETISAGAMKDRYKNNTSIKAVIMPKLIHIYGGAAENSNNGGLMSAFYGCTNLVEINFDSLVNIEGSDAMQEIFRGCSSLAHVNFPSLKYASNCNALMGAFRGCTSLEECVFPELEEILNVRSFGMLFYGCTSLETITFPKLKRIENNAATSSFAVLDVMGGCFYGCTSLTSVYFPSLEYVHPSCVFGVDSGNSDGCGMFSSTPNLSEVHFPSSMQSTIEALDGYSTAWGHGDNSIVKFDL